MSWDVFVQDLPPGARTPADIPDDFQPSGLGLDRRELLGAAQRVGGTVDTTDPSWALWEGPGFDIELNLGDPPVDSFALHCRGDVDACRRAATDLMRALGLRAIAVEDGVIIG